MGVLRHSPVVWLGLAAYLPFVVAALVLFRRADPWRRRWTLAALLVAGAVSAWRFDSTPAGVETDSVHLMPFFPATGFWAMWTSFRTFAGNGWDVLPWWAFNVATGTYYGERVLGLLWHATLILAVGALAPARGVPLALAFTATSPAVLWLSRNSLGVEILVQQLYVIAALDVLRRRRSRGATLIAGLCLGVLHFTYMASRVAFLYPALWLWRTPRRALTVYAIALACLLPMAAADWMHWDDELVRSVYARGTWDWQVAPQMPLHNARSTVVAALWDDGAAVRAGTYCFGGVQTLAPVTLPAMVAGVLSGGGWRYLAAWGAGLLPDIVSAGGGRSHRVMMTIVPTALILGQAGRLGRPWLGALAGGAIAIDNVRRWVQLWDQDAREARHAIPPVSLFPCAEHPAPEWCAW